MLQELNRQLGKLEDYLVSVFNNFPQIPDYVENPLLKYLPFISLLLGVICLFSAYDLWHTAHTVNSLIVYANNYSSTYAVQKMPVNYHMGPAFWLGIISLLGEAYLFFKAMAGVNSKLKSGWNLIYYALTLNVIFGLIMLFSTYGGSGNLVERALFSLFCLYFLFEIRDSYKMPVLNQAKAKKPTKKTTNTKKSAK